MRQCEHFNGQHNKSSSPPKEKVVSPGLPGLQVATHLPAHMYRPEHDALLVAFTWTSKYHLIVVCIARKKRFLQ